MPTLVPVTFADFPALYREQMQPMDPVMSESKWRRLFCPPWHKDDSPLGYALKEAGRFVGFAAYLRGPLVIDGVERTICNFNTWVVDEPYRSAAVSLVMPALKERDLVVTNLTSLPTVHTIFTRLGFRTLESHTRVHWTVPLPFAFGGDVTTGMEIDPALLPPGQASIHAAHRDLAGTALVHGRHGTCYVIYTIGRRKGVRGARIHHVAPRDGLSWALRPLQALMLRRHGAFILEYDRRLAVGAPGPFIDVPFQSPRLYRGTGLEPEQVSNAYSETILLNV